MTVTLLDLLEVKQDDKERMIVLATLAKLRSGAERLGVPEYITKIDHNRRKMHSDGSLTIYEADGVTVFRKIDPDGYITGPGGL